MTLGLGTGSTVHYLLDEIAARIEARTLRDIRGIATSEATARRASELGIPLVPLDAETALDLAIDGADEVDPELRLIKGMGGALLREKIVAAASAAVYIIVDEDKLVQRLGTRSPLPVEVDPFGAAWHTRFFREQGAEPVLRRTAEGQPTVTDGGHYLVDCRYAGGIANPDALAAALAARPGIVEHGLFIGLASAVFVGSESGVRILRR